MIELVTRSVMPAAMSLLPPTMNTPAAQAMLIATGLQESQFLERRQGGNGPARGFWQFERDGGTRGVLQHPATRDHALEALRRLRYQKDGRVITSAEILHAKLEDNDVLACVFARLLLFTVPARLPQRAESQEAWKQYLEAWRPGKPRPETWKAYFFEAWERVDLARDTLPGGEV